MGLEEEHVIGDWNGFEFKMIGQEDLPKILDHARNVFVKDEPFLSCLGYTEGLGTDFCKYVEYALKKNDGLSFYAEHKESKKVAGVRVTYKTPKDAPDPPDSVKATSPEGIQAFHVVNLVYEGAKLFERYGVEFYAELLMTSVMPEFRGQGLVTELYRRSLGLLRAKGYPVAKSFFTSPATRKVAANFGFEEVDRLYFREFTDQNGHRFLPHAGEDQFGATMARRL